MQSHGFSYQVMRKDANTQRSGVTALPVRRLYGRLTWNGIAGYMFFAQYITVARAGTRTSGQVGRIKEFATIPPQYFTAGCRANNRPPGGAADYLQVA
nr:hypothetical protein [uncultured Desulfovibrio sp.]